MVSIKLEKIFHRGGICIKLNAPYNEALIAFIKTLETRRYSATMKCWYIDYSGQALKQIHSLNNGVYRIDENGIVLKYFDLYRSNDDVSLSIADLQKSKTSVMRFIEDNFEFSRDAVGCISIHNINESYDRLLDFFDKELLIPKIIKAKSSIVDNKPTTGVIAKYEIQKMLSLEKNDKNKLMLLLMYSCGLRRNETTSIKRSHIDLEKSELTIYNSKGKIDRIVPFGDRVKEYFKAYFKNLQSKVFLFEVRPGMPYAPEDISKVFRNAIANAKLNERYNVHSLRKSFAMHLQDQGCDLLTIQELLGHKSKKTTSAYTNHKTSNLQMVHDPFEGLNF